ncbi:MAG: hypothetical protein Rsou_0226 [Candidatus Ruthia sp. Asou_11_S2]|nr:hypothetical protein [Candidatus Ruthia sp. Asou_11_S2]
MLIVGTTALAGTEIDTLKDRITALETTQSATSVSGLIEMVYSSSNDKVEFGDLELTVSHAVNEQFDGTIKVKRRGEDDPTKEDDIILDGAMINYHNGGFTASIGRIGVPFGAYGTGMITDPLTKGIISADKGSKDMLMLSADFGDVQVSIYSYKDTDNDTGISINYGKDIFSAGIDYFKDGTTGYGSSNIYHLGVSLDNGLGLYYEAVKTDQGFANSIKAQHTELSYAHQLKGMNASLNLAYSKIDDGDKQKGLTYSFSLAEGVTVFFENNKVDGQKAVNGLKVAYEF